MSQVRRREAASWRSFGLALSNILVFLVFLIAAVAAVAYFRLIASTSTVGVDFRATLYLSAKAVMHGVNPYPAPAAVTSSSYPAVYPPPVILAAMPFALLTYHAAIATWEVLLAIALVLGLAVCGVRDWRCYVAAGLSFPVVNGLASGNVSLVIAGLCGFAWAWRHSLRGSLVLAATLVIKPILWPLIVWHLLRHRYRRALETASFAAVACLVGWALIGFRGLTAYPALLRADTRVAAHNGISVVRILISAGFTVGLASVIGAVMGALLIWLAWRKGDDLDLFAAGMATALVTSPIVFAHYFTVLLIPLAIRHPRFSWLWLIPFALWPIRYAYLPDHTRPVWTAFLGNALGRKPFRCVLPDAVGLT